VDISFRPADPPSRFTSELGEPVTPCLRDAPAIWIDLSPPPVTCSVIQPTTVGQLGPGGLIGDSLANHGEALRLHAPDTTISDAVVFDDGLDADSQWPTVAPGGPSIYVLPPPESYDNFANDDPTRWAASQAGVDEAYAVNPNIVFDAADFSPPFESDDVGSPGKLTGLVLGDCGQTATLIDGNGDGVVDLADFAHFALCLRGPVAETPLNCTCMDADYDGDVDLQDFLTVQADIDTP
jgi:hypothetical protein